MNPVREAIAPYLSLIKLAALAVLVALAFGGGCSVQSGRDAKAMAKKDRALSEAASALRASSAILREVDAQTQAMAREAAEQVKAAKQAEARAAEGAKALRSELAGINADIAKAKRDPDCKRMMEVRTCALLR